MRILLGIIAAGLTASGAQAVTLLNGNFDQVAMAQLSRSVQSAATPNSASGISGWTLVRGGASLVASPDGSLFGGNSVDISTGGAGGVAQKLYDLVAGQRYRISFDLAAAPGSLVGVHKAIVSATGGDPQLFNYVPTATETLRGAASPFTTFFYTFTASGRVQQVQIASLDKNGIGTILDNVSISALPEPTAWTMLIAGFGFVGLAMRRRSIAVVAA